MWSSYSQKDLYLVQGNASCRRTFLTCSVLAHNGGPSTSRAIFRSASSSFLLIHIHNPQPQSSTIIYHNHFHHRQPFKHSSPSHLSIFHFFVDHLFAGELSLSNSIFLLLTLADTTAYIENNPRTNTETHSQCNCQTRHKKSHTTGLLLCLDRWLSSSLPVRPTYCPPCSRFQVYRASEEDCFMMGPATAVWSCLPIQVELLLSSPFRKAGSFSCPSDRGGFGWGTCSYDFEVLRKCHLASLCFVQ
jgi:hypothetical protein